MRNKIYYLGIPGSNSFQAASKIADNKRRLHGLGSFEEIVKKTENEAFSLGVLPIENPLSGRIIEVFDLLAKPKVATRAEHNICINHARIGKKKIAIHKIRH